MGTQGTQNGNGAGNAAAQNAVALAPTKLDQFRMEILPPDKERAFFAGLPGHVKPERFMRNLDIAIMQRPELMKLDPRLIFREISKAASLGLYLDPALGEAYMVEAYNGKAKRVEPQLRIGYRGLIKLGRQSGEISMIYAHEVCASDFLDVDQGAEKKLIHKPKLFTDRGAVIGYYAVVKYKDGDFDFEPLSIPQAHKIRDRSDGWKAFKEGKIKSTPWATDEDEMSKKTVIRKLSKRIPQSPELAEAIRIEDAAEHSEMRAIEHEDPLGLIADNSARSGPPSAPAAPAAPRAPAQASTASGGHENGQDDIIDAIEDEYDDDPESVFKDADDKLALANTLEDAEEIWSNFEHFQEKFFPPDWDHLASIKKRHLGRIERMAKQGAN